MRKVALPLLMGTARLSGAPGGLAALLVAIALAGACGPGSTTAHSPAPVTGSSSPSAGSSATPSTNPSANPSPAPVTGAYGILVSSQASTNYTVSLVGIDGRVIASAQASTPAAVNCANAAAAIVPLPVSTSNTRVYYMDAQGVVRFLAPNGDAGKATTVPIGTARRSMFAVSPDDQRIAVIVDDFTSSGASTRLYAEDLNGGGNHLDLFSQTGAFTLWPTGWHGTNNLVLAKVPACTQGGGFGCCGPQELHVVDPATAVRRFTIGGSTCIISGPAAPAGASCETTTGTANVYSWTAALLRTYPIPGVGMGPIYLSPNGQHLALSSNPNETTVEGYNNLTMIACGWIDDTHLIAGGDAQNQPRIGEVTTGKILPVAAQGDCGGRIPGGL
ncbi:MAG: hypothetical protein ABI334_04675 [Candidatus Dormiibacterota bacterium]